MNTENTFIIDGSPIPFEPGQTVLEAALKADVFIPHLCYFPGLRPNGNCKLCTISINGKHSSACTTLARPGSEIENNTPALNDKRRLMLQMLFVEGNHFCPGCEKSGNCQLQALAYELEMMTPHFNHFFPNRKVDASHPEAFLDMNRCITCGLCVQASRDVDKKNIFILSGRGMASHVVINSPSGNLGDSDFSMSDKAASVCPVGAILPKHRGYSVPIGKRLYDGVPISSQTEFLKTRKA
ncbi:MAG: 2Fe-2S iron-sulfur cluster-binding protein [Betaproteobacteria bacterium]|nr:2Fe-2S iron-sulfur cluster-binding protein [Betaproteobacteria bacterium]MCL2885264.1 2Fe-2S iron-sulfur cluster-binding protein [Betaproteobacteria bacterium]